MNKSGTRVLILIFSILVIVTLPKEAIRRTIYYFRFSGFGARQLEVYLRNGTAEFLVCLVFVIMVIVFFRTLFKLIFSPGNQKVDGLNQPRRENRKNSTQKTPGGARTSLNSQGTRVSAPGTSGDKYLEQLDGFLESGLVTKEEYQQLRERYRRAKR